MNTTKNKVKRRDFLQLVSASSIIAATGAPLISFASKRDEIPATSFRFLSDPYLQNPTSTAISVCWITDRRCYSWVELQSESQPSIKVHSSTNGLIDANNRIHKIRIQNLRPGTDYTYKVYSKEILTYEPYRLVYGKIIESKPYHFTTLTENAESVSLIILNDIHDRPESIPHLMNLVKDQPFDFVFLNGDMFDDQKDENQIIEHLLNPCSQSFSTERAFMFLRGNHETRGVFSRNLGDYFENIDQQNYFSFQQGPVYFIALDTGEDKEDSHPEYGGLADFDSYREKQAIWLESQLKSTAYKSARFKVVIMHIPHYHSGDWHGTMHCRALFGPLFNKYKIDMLISGHTHTFGIHKAQEGHNFPIIIGGAPIDTKRTIMRLSANKSLMKVAVTLDTGEVIGEYTIEK